MHTLSIITDSTECIGFAGTELTRFFEPRLTSRCALTTAPISRHALIDIDFMARSDFTELSRWVHRLPKDRIVVFVVDHGVRLQSMQAYALGATDVITRPVEEKALLGKLMGGPASPVEDWAAVLAEAGPGVAAGSSALESIFASAVRGAPIDEARLNEASGAVVSQIEATGLGEWIDTVRMHHSQTYQHCLLVTGVAVAFACQLGFSRVDRSKLALAGLLHDVGKARIPLSILEKPGPLDDNEMKTMRQHPELGFAALQSARGLGRDILDMVLHHHEFLDGSGYPHRLRGREVSDLVRIVTISDIFGALLERRSYKAALSGSAAYAILEKMGAKLDPDITREFASIARMRN